jgi:hypothetical protein
MAPADSNAICSRFTRSFAQCFASKVPASAFRMTGQQRTHTTRTGSRGTGNDCLRSGPLNGLSWILVAYLLEALVWC